MPDIIALLSKDQFAAWLHSHNPAANVGISGRYDQCPLATYLRESGVPSAGVLTNGRQIVADGERIRAPKWVGQFVKAIDGLRDEQGEERDHVPVRAYRAWNVLEGKA